MDDESRMKIMKDRIIKSYAWQRDIIIPLSKDYDCTTEELEDLFFDLFDMSTLEAFHGTFESAEEICLYHKFHADLRLCWYVDTLEILRPEDSKKLKEKLVGKVMDGKSYDEVLKEGQLELFNLLKEESKY